MYAYTRLCTVTSWCLNEELHKTCTKINTSRYTHLGSLIQVKSEEVSGKQILEMNFVININLLSSILGTHMPTVPPWPFLQNPQLYKGSGYSI